MLDQEPDKRKEKAAIASETDHFRSLALALPTINDAAFKPMFISRTLTDNNRGHSLMAGTFNTPETIAHLLSFFRAPPSRSLNDDVSTRAEVRRFYTFGTGLNAHANLLHGGIIACLIDSTMSNMAGLALQSMHGLDSRETVFTVQLNTKDEKPVRTPGTVMVRAWIKESLEGGRKIWITGEVVSGDHGEIRHAGAEGLWLRARVGKL